MTRRNCSPDSTRRTRSSTRPWGLRRSTGIPPRARMSGANGGRNIDFLPSHLNFRPIRQPVTSMRMKSQFDVWGAPRTTPWSGAGVVAGFHLLIRQYRLATVRLMLMSATVRSFSWGREKSLREEITRPDHGEDDDEPLENLLVHPAHEEPPAHEPGEERRGEGEVHPQGFRRDEPELNRKGQLDEVEHPEEPRRRAEEHADGEAGGEEIHAHHRPRGVRDHRRESPGGAVQHPRRPGLPGGGGAALVEREGDDDEEDQPDRDRHLPIGGAGEKAESEDEPDEDGGNDPDEDPPLHAPAVHPDRAEVAEDEEHEECHGGLLRRQQRREDGARDGDAPRDRALAEPGDGGGEREQRPGEEG